MLVSNTFGNKDGYTPLHFAVERVNEEIIKLFLSKGANVNAAAKDGTTSLHLTIQTGYLKMVEHL